MFNNITLKDFILFFIPRFITENVLYRVVEEDDGVEYYEAFATYYIGCSDDYDDDVFVATSSSLLWLNIAFFTKPVTPMYSLKKFDEFAKDLQNILDKVN